VGRGGRRGEHVHAAAERALACSRSGGFLNGFLDSTHLRQLRMDESEVRRDVHHTRRPHLWGEEGVVVSTCMRRDVHHTRRPYQVPLHRQIEAQKALELAGARLDLAPRLKLAARLELAARLNLAGAPGSAGATAQGGAQLWEIMRELCPRAAAQARRIVRRLVIPVGRGRRDEHLHAARATDDGS
jgi:hypothetical protein